MLKKTAYILIGDDLTGKTTFQKHLILQLCGINKFDRLYTNLIHDINHPNSSRKLKTLFTMNRSIQEKMGDYKSVENFFKNYFKDADICILSSHAHDDCIITIEKMIEYLKSKYYNVEGVFFSNHLNEFTKEISKLSWHGVNVINNPENKTNWEKQIEFGALNLTESIIRNYK